MESFSKKLAIGILILMPILAAAQYEGWNEDGLNDYGQATVGGKNTGTPEKLGQLTVEVDAAARKGVVIKAAGSQTGNLFDVLNSSGTSLFSIDGSGAFGLTTGIILEGATANAYETTIGVVDPTVDRTITLPDYSGDVPIVIVQSSTQTSVNNTTATIDGSSLTIANGWFSAGKVLEWEVVGTITGTNAAKSIVMFIDDAAIVTLSTQAGTAGDYVARCTVSEHTAYANQKVWCEMFVATGADVEFDYATDTTNFNDGGTTPIKMQAVSGNGGDTITVENVTVKHWN